MSETELNKEAKRKRIKEKRRSFGIERRFTWVKIYLQRILKHQTFIKCNESILTDHQPSNIAALLANSPENFSSFRSNSYEAKAL